MAEIEDKLKLEKLSLLLKNINYCYYIVFFISLLISQCEAEKTEKSPQTVMEDDSNQEVEVVEEVEEVKEVEEVEEVEDPIPSLDNIKYSFIFDENDPASFSLEELFNAGKMHFIIQGKSLSNEEIIVSTNKNEIIEDYDFGKPQIEYDSTKKFFPLFLRRILFRKILK